jgi:hypothetical protein
MNDEVDKHKSALETSLSPIDSNKNLFHNPRLQHEPTELVSPNLSTDSKVYNAQLQPTKPMQKHKPQKSATFVSLLMPLNVSKRKYLSFQIELRPWCNLFATRTAIYLQRVQQIRQ